MGQDSEPEFREWVTARRSQLRRTAYLLCGDWHLADDLVQEALTRAFAVWGRVTRTGQPDAYVRKILLNLYLDHRRRPARRESAWAELPDVTAAGGDVESLGERERVLAALRRVAPGQRAVLVLRFWEDLSVEQSAQALGVSTGNIKSQTSRGLEALRGALATYQEETP
ncbi:SigE family RNA polymerase sigma factor [Nocardioides sp. cx-169]|uniref:SigE family RNA polymerase sigma factor n=1 Tax=Nocardioides sp. cx-169 TaxID=2899080 RepID=UPI001E3DF0F5|nr:SigE family RNA polymerase sigma factor [Nocardioides sp. cx-169]MCD4536263.1 SigE family RNA polymerase sigma factor [Nocardioides sp. cx-169]